MRMIMTSTAVNMIDQFNASNMRILREMGVEVHVATNFKEGSTTSDERTAEFKKELDAAGIRYHQIGFSRRPLAVWTHIRAYKAFLKLLREEDIDFIHCHSPICSVLTRLAAKKKGARAIYTAHGFHFYDGAPVKNWLLFYPVEKHMSRYTDVLILLNEEDYNRASSRFYAKKTVKLNGIGIDLDRFAKPEHSLADAKRRELGLSDDDIMLLSVGELIPRKDHETILRALAILGDERLKLFICGIGPLGEELQRLAAELGLGSRVRLLGYRSDIPELNAAADGFIFSSIHEGMPVALMEAIASKTPVICSRIRGSVDQKKDEDSLYRTGDATELAERIRERFCEKSRSKIEDGQRDVTEESYRRLQEYSKERIDERMSKIYRQMVTDAQSGRYDPAQKR